MHEIEKTKKETIRFFCIRKMWQIMKPISEDCRRQTQKYTLLQNHGKKSKKPKPIKVF